MYARVVRVPPDEEVALSEFDLVVGGHEDFHKGEVSPEERISYSGIGMAVKKVTWGYREKRCRYRDSNLCAIPLGVVH